MTLGLIYQYGYAFRDYSDPDDFVPPENETKYKHFNANTDTLFEEVWQNMIWTQYSDYFYLPIADSYFNSSTMGNIYVDYLSLAYNNTVVNSYVQERYLKMGNSYLQESIFYKNPDIVINSTTDNILEFPDIVFPYLSQGYLRTGYQGRDSLLVLDASNFGGHHHYDSLNLVYSKDGRELLNDLGYLWDHVNASYLSNTNAHHTVLIDGERQIGSGRNGSVHLFSTHGNVKVMQASSNAYKKASIYNRTVIQITHNSSKKNYIVDIFRASGGSRREYVFHGVHYNYTINQKLKYEHDYETTTYKGCVRMSINKKGGFSISKVVLQQIKSDGTKGENMVQTVPADAFTKKEERCPVNGTWCYYIGDGKANISVDNSGPGNARTINFEATEPDARGVYNVALNIGNSDGYTAPNALEFEKNKKYYLEFYIKGSLMPTILIQYWSKGEETNMSARKYSSKLSQTTTTVISQEWQKVTGTLIIGTEEDGRGAEFTEELKIKWNIDDNYTFTSFTPKRNVNGEVKKQMVFYRDGWGQRDYRNTDYGVTLPYFYMYRNSKDEKLSTFVNVFEGSYKNEDIVKDVFIEEQGNGSVAIKIETKEGTDYVLSSFYGNEVNGFGFSTNAQIAVQIGEDENSQDPSTPMMINGEYFTSSESILRGKRDITGSINKNVNEKTESWFEITNNEIDLSKDFFDGLCIHVKGECGSISDIERAYPIRKIVKSGSNTYRVYTRTESVGFRTHCHSTWRIPYYSSASTTKTNACGGLSKGSIAAIVIVAYWLLQKFN